MVGLCMVDSWYVTMAAIRWDFIYHSLWLLKWQHGAGVAAGAITYIMLHQVFAWIRTLPYIFQFVMM